MKVNWEKIYVTTWVGIIGLIAMWKGYNTELLLAILTGFFGYGGATFAQKKREST